MLPINLPWKQKPEEVVAYRFIVLSVSNEFSYFSSHPITHTLQCIFTKCLRLGIYMKIKLIYTLHRDNVCLTGNSLTGVWKFTLCLHRFSPSPPLSLYKQNTYTLSWLENGSSDNVSAHCVCTINGYLLTVYPCLLAGTLNWTKNKGFAWELTTDYKKNKDGVNSTLLVVISYFGFFMWQSFTACWSVFPTISITVFFIYKYNNYNTKQPFRHKWMCISIKDYHNNAVNK